MGNQFTKDFFTVNRRRLLQAHTDSADVPIVITANGLLQRSADTTFKFRQDSNFWYLTGVNFPDIILVMDDGDEYLIVPTRDTVLETFEGKIEPDWLTAVSGIGCVLDQASGWERLARSVKSAKQVATLAPPAAYIEAYQFYANPARAALVDKIKAINGAVECVDLRGHLANMRVVKQAPELAAIRKAVDVTASGIRTVTDRRRLAKYAYEYELEADLTRHFRRQGCGHAFDPIVANGERAVQMHATENNGGLLADQMTIVDVGAEASWYAADIARTVMSGKPSRRQRALYDAVCEAQDYAYSLIKPGVDHLQYEKDNEQYIGEKLRELGVIKTIDKESVRRHYPHMMSHFVGLDAHDVGDYHQPMQAGSVMVVEAGMYIPKEGIGVRIEDVVVVTDDGYELLSAALPRTLTP